ncbi:DUF945 family protein [Campylobacter sp. 2018MI35]|uniref:DUF945 family protein n=1 Tax=Campylobacter sp. 2018MI34 TaxID=2800582 RepID=UPI0019089BE5|nr:DUF945 family protein [Campylobacter sp. 2018MI34]MBK1992086.1 DUF945 family protein [Campylobacter sp. 2018MI34]
MKKIISIFIILIIAYFTHIFYVGKMNQKIFNLITQNTEFYKIENINFDQGFFKSHITYDMIFTNLNKNLKTKIELNMYNNFFTSKNLEGNFSNPFLNSNETLGKFDAKLTLNDTNFNIYFNDVNLSHKEEDFIFKGLKANILFDKQTKIKNASLDIEQIIIDSFYEHIQANKISFNNYLNSALSIDEFLNTFYESEQEIRISDLDIDKINFKNIVSKIDTNLNNNKTLNFNILLNIDNISNEITPDSKEEIKDLKLNLSLNQISKETLENLNKELNQGIKPNLEFYLTEFLAFNPSLNIQEFSFSKNKKEIKMNANIQAFNRDYQAKATIISDEIVSKLFPSTIFMGGFDEYFIQKDGKYVMDLSISDTKNDSHIKINGNDLNLGISLD